jgi:hypothetical protein
MSQFYKKDDINKKIVTIIDEQDTFYQLSDGQMIKKDIFNKYYLPFVSKQQNIPQNTTTNESLEIDPVSFLNTPSVKQDVLEKIKNTDASKVPDTKMSPQVKNIPDGQESLYNNESLVKQVEDLPIPNNTNTDVSQYKVYDDDDDAYNDFVKKSQHPPVQQQPTQKPKPMSEIEKLFEDEKMAFGEEEAIKRRYIRLKRNPVEQQPTEQKQTNQQFDPSEMMFKSFKRNHPISVTIKFEDKIGNPDFVKMMMENMDGDIVGYYKKIIMNNIINNIKHIEDEVEMCIKKEIFGDELESELIPGGKTKSGKQQYKYIDDNGKIVEMLPSTAKKKNLKPYKPE